MIFVHCCVIWLTLLWGFFEKFHFTHQIDVSGIEISSVCCNFFVWEGFKWALRYIPFWPGNSKKSEIQKLKSTRFLFYCYCWYVFHIFERHLIASCQSYIFIPAKSMSEQQ
jgi:hypothetical protein